MTDTPNVIIKKDHNFWNPHIENCERAGISANQYCRENNLSSSQFSYWRNKKYREQHDDFVGVKVTRKNEVGCLCVLEFSKGQKLLIYDIECVRFLPQILELGK